MRKKKELEDVLKEKFSGLELEQDPHMLENIYSKLAESPAKKKNTFPLLAAAAVTGILILAVTLTFYFKTDTTRKELGRIAPVEKTKPPINDTMFSEKAENTAPMTASSGTGHEHKVRSAETAKTGKEKSKPEGFVAADSRQTYILPDSSRIFLNTYSKVTLTAFNEAGRSLSLEGEAFFEVKNKGGIPFTVHCGNAYIQVIGTSFNIRASGRDSIEVWVEEGKVRFESRENPAASVLLERGQNALLANGSMHKNFITDPNYLVWKTGILTFRQTSMVEALKVMQDYFNVKIQADNEDILNCHVTGKFTRPELNKVLDSFGKILGINYRREHDTYILSGKGCK